MKKINVVKSNEEFNEVIQKGKSYKNFYFVIYVRKNNLDKYRFGLTVGKKVCNAVNRNKLKRQIRNILDNNKKYYSKGKDYIIIIRKSCLNEKFNKLEENLIYLLKKVEKEYQNEEK